MRREKSFFLSLYGQSFYFLFLAGDTDVKSCPYRNFRSVLVSHMIISLKMSIKITAIENMFRLRRLPEDDTIFLYVKYVCISGCIGRLSVGSTGAVFLFYLLCVITSSADKIRCASSKACLYSLLLVLVGLERSGIKTQGQSKLFKVALIHKDSTLFF